MHPVTQQQCITSTLKHTVEERKHAPTGTTERQLSDGCFYFYLCCCMSWKADSRVTDVILFFHIAVPPNGVSMSCVLRKQTARSKIPP